jgi:hypothetical protein
MWPADAARTLLITETVCRYVKKYSCRSIHINVLPPIRHQRETKGTHTWPDPGPGAKLSWREYIPYQASPTNSPTGGWGSHVLDLANQIPACAKIHRLVLTVITCFETVTGRH